MGIFRPQNLGHPFISDGRRKPLCDEQRREKQIDMATKVAK